jgi:hypothetical protein
MKNGDAMWPFVGLHGSNDFQLRKVHNRDCPIGRRVPHDCPGNLLPEPAVRKVETLHWPEAVAVGPLGFPSL